MHTISGQLYTVTELTGFAIDLYTVMQKLFEVGTVEYAIASRL